MYKISDKVIKFIAEAMKNWNVELSVGRKTLAEVKIHRDLFQGDSLSPLLFAITMMPLTYLGSAQRATNIQNHKERLITLCTGMILSYLSKMKKNWRLI